MQTKIIEMLLLQERVTGNEFWPSHSHCNSLKKNNEQTLMVFYLVMSNQHLCVCSFPFLSESKGDKEILAQLEYLYQIGKHQMHEIIRVTPNIPQSLVVKLQIRG